MTRRHVLAIAAAITIAISTGVMAKQQRVILKDGRRLSGDVTKTKDGYEIRTAVGTVVLAEKDVLRVEEALTPQEEFKTRLAQTSQKDPDALYRLASWARDNDLLPEARSLLKKVLTLKGDHHGARLLLKLVEIGMAGPETAPDTKTQPAPQVDTSNLVKMEDIYRIRLVELRASDRVSIDFRNKVLERFVEAMRGEGMFSRPSGERRFRGWPRVRQVRYMLDYTDREDTAIRDDIIIKTDPAVFRTFRARIWPIVNEGCARPSCHGGTEGAGKLKLFDMPATNDRVLYTNFYILHAWQLGRRKLIDRDIIGKSMLLQAGLPKGIAKQDLAHPKELVPPVFTSERDRNFRLIEDWIASLSRLLPPGYRVNYRLPALPDQPPAATQPAPAKEAEPEPRAGQ